MTMFGSQFFFQDSRCSMCTTLGFIFVCGDFIRKSVQREAFNIEFTQLLVLHKALWNGRSFMKNDKGVTFTVGKNLIAQLLYVSIEFFQKAKFYKVNQFP